MSPEVKKKKASCGFLLLIIKELLLIIKGFLQMLTLFLKTFSFHILKLLLEHRVERMFLTSSL